MQLLWTNIFIPISFLAKADTESVTDNLAELEKWQNRE